MNNLSNCQTKCIHCEYPAVTRGVCRQCYFLLRTLINKGDTTDEALIAENWWLPCKKPGRHASDNYPKTNGKCKVCSRKRKDLVRGLCSTCYREIRQAISEGRVVEQDLIDGGILGESPVTAKKAVSDLLAKYERKGTL